MENLNLFINSLGLASFFVVLWLLVVFFSNQLYFYDQKDSTEDHLVTALTLIGIIALVVVSLVDIGYCYSEWYRMYFQWFMSVPLLICLCIFFIALVKSSKEIAEGASLWAAMMSFFFLGSSLAWQVALQNYSPKQGCLYLISFNVFWWVGMIVFSRCIMFWRARIISEYLGEIISYSKDEDGKVCFSFKNEKKALKFSKFIPGYEFVAVIGGEVWVSRRNGDQKFNVETINFKRAV